MKPQGFLSKKHQPCIWNKTPPSSLSAHSWDSSEVSCDFPIVSWAKTHEDTQQQIQTCRPHGDYTKLGPKRGINVSMYEVLNIPPVACISDACLLSHRSGARPLIKCRFCATMKTQQQPNLALEPFENKTCIPSLLFLLHPAFLSWQDLTHTHTSRKKHNPINKNFIQLRIT